MDVKRRVCPVCGDDRVLIILRDGRTGLCYACGSQWVETNLGEMRIVSIPGHAFGRTGTRDRASGEHQAT